MKRAPWYVVAGTVAGFAGVVGLHHSRPTSVALPASTPRPGTGSAQHPGAGAGPGHSAPQGGAAATPATPAAPSGPAHSATGTMEQYGYGELDVKVTVKGTRITGVVVPTLRTAEPYSQQLADQVIPMLRSEVLSAQGTSINGISGATYTCEAYAASLQSALDKLHIK